MFSWPANLFQAISPASNPTLVTQAGQGGKRCILYTDFLGFSLSDSLILQNRVI